MKDHREKIYISYDSTNKNCQAGELQMVEFGHPKEDKGLPCFRDNHKKTALCDG